MIIAAVLGDNVEDCWPQSFVLGLFQQATWIQKFNVCRYFILSLSLLHNSHLCIGVSPLHIARSRRDVRWDTTRLSWWTALVGSDEKVGSRKVVPFLLQVKTLQQSSDSLLLLWRLQTQTKWHLTINSSSTYLQCVTHWFQHCDLVSTHSHKELVRCAEDRTKEKILLWIWRTFHSFELRT